MDRAGRVHWAMGLAIGAAAWTVAATMALAQNAPSVVFLHGLGDGPATFDRNIAQLPDTVTVFADNRPANAAPLTPAAAASALMARLDAAGIAPPYVLVGHSIAGLYVLEFARAYPQQVAGILLDDARLPGFDTVCKAAQIKGCQIPSLLYAVLPRSQRAELDGAKDMLHSLAAPRDWDGIPMTLLVAGRPTGGQSRAFQDVWIAHATAFAAALPRARLVVVKGARHYIHKDAAAVFNAELTALLALQK